MISFIQYITLGLIIVKVIGPGQLGDDQMILLQAKLLPSNSRKKLLLIFLRRKLVAMILVPVVVARNISDVMRLPHEKALISGYRF